MDINFAPLVQALIGLLAVVLSTVSVYLARRLAQRYDMTDYLPVVDNYIKEGIGYAKKQALRKTNVDSLTIHMDQDDFTSEVVNYVAKNVPSAIKRLNLTEENIKAKSEAMIGRLYADKIQRAKESVKNKNTLSNDFNQVIIEETSSDVIQNADSKTISPPQTS